jgi:hypothetical protein
MTDFAKALDAYVRFYDALSPETLPEIDKIFTPDARFCDPFNDVHGPDKIRRVFQDMFETVGRPEFKVTDSAWSESAPDQCYIRWIFKYRPRYMKNRSRSEGEPITVEGMSAVRFAPDGRVAAHIDYWDAARGLWEHVPVIGSVLRWLRGRVRIKD